jgi:hypothetical protein
MRIRIIQHSTVSTQVANAVYHDGVATQTNDSRVRLSVWGNLEGAEVERQYPHALAAFTSLKGQFTPTTFVIDFDHHPAGWHLYDMRISGPRVIKAGTGKTVSMSGCMASVEFDTMSGPVPISPLTRQIVEYVRKELSLSL